MKYITGLNNIGCKFPANEWVFLKILRSLIRGWGGGGGGSVKSSNSATPPLPQRKQIKLSFQNFLSSMNLYTNRCLGSTPLLFHGEAGADNVRSEIVT